MGKTSRKTKAKKGDFNKVKLKAGKKKPLADNITRTNFKSQQVFVTTQFRADHNQTGALTNKLSLSIDELISKTKHHAPTHRYNAIKQLRDYVLETDRCHLSLYPILQRANRGISDDDDEVRKISLSLLEEVFKKLPVREMEVKFKETLTYLNISMCSTRCKNDSLKALDLVLTHYTTLMDETACFKILNEFIGTIEDQHKYSAKAGSDKKDVMLAQYLVSFERCWKVLVACTKGREEEKKKQEKLRLHFRNPYRIHPRHEVQQMKHSKMVSDEEKRSICDKLYKLVLTAWREVILSDAQLSGKFTSSIMCEVVKITLQMVKVITFENQGFSVMQYIHSTFVESFSRNFYKNFPYKPFSLGGSEVPYKRRRKDKNSKNEQASKIDFKRKLVECNLEICKLYFTLTDHKSMQQYRKSHVVRNMMVQMSEYIVDIVVKRPIAQLVQKNPADGSCLLRNCLECLNQLVKLKDPETSCEIGQSMMRMYRRHCNNENGLFFIEFIKNAYEAEYISTVDGDNCEIKNFLGDILRDLIEDIRTMKEVKKTCSECIFKKLKDHPFYKKFQCKMSILKKAHVTQLAAYDVTIKDNIEGLLEVLSSGFCCDSHCIKCLMFLWEFMECTLSHLHELPLSLAIKLYDYSPSHKYEFHVQDTIIDILKKNIFNSEHASQDCKHNVLMYFLMIIHAGHLEYYKKQTKFTNEELNRIDENCRSALTLWSQISGERDQLIKRFQLNMSQFYLHLEKYNFPISSWIGYFRMYEFAHKQEISIKTPAVNEYVGKLVAKGIRKSYEDKLEASLLIICKQLFSIKEIKKVCLQYLIDNDDYLPTIIDMWKDNLFCNHLSKTADSLLARLNKRLQEDECKNEHERSMGRKKCTEILRSLIKN